MATKEMSGWRCEKGKNMAFGGVGITCLTAFVFALSAVGTANASPTTLNVESANATVNGALPVTMSFPLERSGDLGFDTWLHYETEDGSARAGTDYTSSSGYLKLPAGASEKSIPIQVSGQAAFAPDKQFSLKLFGATGVGPPPSFAERVGFAVGSVRGRAKVADVNGDGKPDLIVPNTKTVSVLLNTTAPGAASPSFAAPQIFEVGGNPDVAPGDVNGDGRPDLVVTNSADDDFSVLINTTAPGAATPSFASQQVFEAGRGPHWPVFEDVNGDGRPDLIIVNDQFDEQAISVFFNTTPLGASTASFQPRQFFEFFSPGRVAAADVNGDGRPDLIISSQGPVNEVFVILNATPPGASNLSLGGEASYPVGETPNEVRVADLNGDGRPDLAVSNLLSDSASVLLNTTAPGASIPTFLPQQSFAVDNEPRSIRAVDLNGDGRADLITANPGHHSLSVLLNTTAPGASALSFAAQTLEAEPFPLGLVIADLNGDGRQDLVYTRESGKVLVSLNTTAAPTATAPSLAPQQEEAAGGHPSSLEAADLNGDGKPDLVIANRDDDNVSARLDTTAPGALIPSFAAQQTFAAGNAPTAVATADFNLDGRADLAVSDEFEETVSTLLGTTAPGAGTPSFAVRQSFAAGESPSAIAAADFNLDGKPDLVVANRDEDDVSVLLDTTAPGVSTLSFAPQHAFFVGNAPSAVAAADLNGDGKLDLVVVNKNEDTASILFNTTTPGASTPSFDAPQAFGTEERPSSITTADLNGDGIPDLVITNEGSDSVSVLLNTTSPGASTPSFASLHSFEAGDRPSAVTTADLNGNGVPDLLVSNEGGDTASVFLNTTEPGAGAPSFAAQQSFATGDSPTAVTTADLNGDGGPDVIAADGESDTISSLLDSQYAASVSPAGVTGTIHYAIPQNTLSSSSLAFGEQVVGSSVTKAVTISNTGGADLTIDGIAVGGVNAVEFGQTNTCPATLEPGATCSVSLSFAPNGPGTAGAALAVTSNSPTSPDTVALSGTGITPPVPTRTLKIERAGGGGGRVEGGAGAISCPSVCSHAFAEGAEVTLTAIPASGSVFAGWSGGDCPGTSTCHATVVSDTTVSARFEKAPLAPSRLRIAKASAKGGAFGLRIAIHGTIAMGARGKVAVKARVRTHGSWVTVAKRTKIAEGKWGTHLVLGAPIVRGSPIHLSVKFQGSPGFHSGHVARRIRRD